MNEIVNAAVELMLLGMGTVFVFLVLLIYSTKVMSFFVIKMQGESQAAASVATSPRQTNFAVQEHHPKLLKAIGEAIKQHRSNP